MYKHFAAVTIGVTAMVGLLADGEAQKAVEQQLEEKAERERIANADALSNGNRRRIIEGEESVGTGSFGPGTAMGLTAAGFDSSTTERSRREAIRTEDAVPIYTRIGLSKKEWFALSEESRKELEKKYRELTGEGARTTTPNMRAIAEASRQRAGAGSGSGAAAFSTGSDAPGDY